MALMKNEWIKAWHGRKIWVFLLVLAVCILLGSILTGFLLSFSEGELGGPFFLLLGFTTLVPFVNIYMVVQITGAIAGEYRSGTIKQLLIRPVSRNKLLFVKWFSMSILGILLISLLVLILYLLNMIFFDSASTWSAMGGQALEFIYLSIPTMLFYLFLAALFAALTRSTAVTIIITLVPYFFGGLFNILLEFYEWPKWIVLTHLDLVGLYGMGDVGAVFMTTPFERSWQSILFILLHVVVFAVIAHILFKKRDVL